MLELDIDLEELRGEIEHWSREFGETSDQALYRLAARTAAHAAVQTDPVGKSTRKRQEGAIWKGIRRSVIVLPKKRWTFTKNMDRPRVKWDGIYFQVHRNQFTMDAAEVNRHIDRLRGGRANPKRTGVLQKKIIPETTLRKITSGRGRENRIRRAGLAKGGWIGAGMEVQRWVKWGGRRPLGKNWMNWTHKWAKKGSARRIRSENGAQVVLQNSAPYIHRIFNDAAAMRAMRTGWAATLTWYKAAVADLDRQAGV